MSSNRAERQLIPESVRICPTEKHQPVYSALTRTIKSLNFIGLARHRNQDFYMDPIRPFPDLMSAM